MLYPHLITQNLEPAILEQIATLEVFPSIDSSNSYLLAKTKEHPGQIMACFASLQTAARGRRGKTWHAPDGISLSFSIAYPFLCATAKLSGLSLAVGTVLCKLLRELGLSQVAVKWPNDLMCSGHKLAGILVEMPQVSLTNTIAVIGIGINMAESQLLQPSQDRPITSLAELGLNIDREVLAAKIVNHLLPALDAFSSTGLKTFLADWHQCDALMGQELLISHGDHAISGTYAGISSQGNLLLNADGKISEFASGEISVRNYPCN